MDLYLPTDTMDSQVSGKEASSERKVGRTDTRFTTSGLYLWVNTKGQCYGGQSINIKNRWNGLPGKYKGHWELEGGQRFHREVDAMGGQAGVMLMQVQDGIDR
jgi:hypothetical protein